MLASCHCPRRFLQLRGDQRLDRAGLEQRERAHAYDRGDQEPHHYGAAHAGPIDPVLTHGLATYRWQEGSTAPGRFVGEER